MNGTPDDNIFEADGFAKAEKKAKEMLLNLIKDGWSSTDTYVCISENGRDVVFLDTDMYILKRDCCGEIAWFKNVYGSYCYVCERLLDDEEKAELDVLRNEKEIHVRDLSEDDLKKLRREIYIGSIYLPDYENSFYIDEYEVFNYSQSYEEWLDNKDVEDSPEEFSYYVREVS